jgi:hypothetical protein
MTLATPLHDSLLIHDSLPLHYTPPTKFSYIFPMTRRTNPNTVKKEAQLQQAIAAYRNKEKTASGAIHDFNVPHRTFFSRLGGIAPRNLVHEKEQL